MYLNFLNAHEPREHAVLGDLKEILVYVWTLTFEWMKNTFFALHAPI